MRADRLVAALLFLQTRQRVTAAQLAGLGARVELLEPPEARAALSRIGAELTSPYGA
ncbi:hypothetical protein [Streptomyces exfoliatus]|uniref:hypothetical protein n=1 Tax=Streptomyces exfoliatus TaxID=1905 RepID=UPI003C2CA616